MYKQLLGLTLTLSVSLFANPLYAQDAELHSPQEILQIMDNSDLTYEIDAIDEELDCEQDDNNVNTVYMYSLDADDGREKAIYKMSDEAEAYFLKAEQFFIAKEIDSARRYYGLVADLHKDFSMPVTYIGQSYEIQGDTSKAIEYYEKAVKLNFYDFTAHWFLADCYLNKGMVDSAIRQITVANVLNRNNPRLKQSLKSIYKTAGKTYNEWCFIPQVKVSKSGKKVAVKYASNWIGFALAKAVWEYEPGYRKQMGVTGDGYSIVEDKECLAMLAMTLSGDDKKQWKMEPCLNALMVALDDKLFHEYLAYELVMYKYPGVAYYYSPSYINEIADYVLKIRTL